MPLIAAERIVLWSPQGVLRCLDRKTGKELWSRDARVEFKAPDGYFGFGSTPLLASVSDAEPGGTRVVVNVGAKGACVVAFALADGKTLWQAGDDAASYSAPILIPLAGKARIVCVSRLKCLLIDPVTGTIVSEIPFGARGPTVNAATPVVVGDHLLLTASYGVGAAWVKLSEDKLTLEWKDDDLLSSQYTTPIAHRGLLYGIHGRQDVGVAELRCVDPVAKKVLWKEEGFGTANMILADDKLIVVKTDGEGLLVEPTGERYKLLAKATLADDIVQALSAYDDGRLFVRRRRPPAML
ncbi:MAG: PQQ-binding-like beta-propeller repeat protein [Pirellulales bacterium]